MCDCQTRICEIFDAMVRELHHDHPRLTSQVTFPDTRRSPYMLMELNTPSAEEGELFPKFVEAATGIGFAPGEFIHELGRQTGFGDSVTNWARGKVPNGWVRKIILTRAEKIIRERGARPELTLLQQAA